MRTPRFRRRVCRFLSVLSLFILHSPFFILPSRADPTFRVTEYHLSDNQLDTGQTTYDLQLTGPLAADYFILVRGSRTGNGGSNPDNDYLRVWKVPGGRGGLGDSGSAELVQLVRHVGDLDWEGVITVVECLGDQSASGFRLVDIVETRLDGASTRAAAATSGVAEASASWSDIGRVVLFGGHNGGGMSFEEDAIADDTNDTDAMAGFVRLYPSGTNTLHWERNLGNELSSVETNTLTTFVVEWGTEWTVQRVRVNGSANGPGPDTAGEFLTASIASVPRGSTWVWGTGNSTEGGIGASAEGAVLTLGDGSGTENATESTVAVGTDETCTFDFDVYAMTHSGLAVDHHRRAYANITTNYVDENRSVDPAESGRRFAWVYNGCNGAGEAFNRPLMWARYYGDSTIRISRGYNGQQYAAYLQGIDFSGISYTAVDADWALGYGFRMPLVVSSNIVTGATLTNFPLLVSVTAAALRSVSNGGDVQSTNGYDIVFADASGARLPHELERYTATNGHVVAWVRVPHLYSHTNTALYVYYGAPVASTQEDAAGVWAEDYLAVWHLGEDPSQSGTPIVDSTGKGNDGDPNANMTADDLTGGMIGGCLEFDGNDGVDVPAVVGDRAEFTIFLWWRSTSASLGNGEAYAEWGAQCMCRVTINDNNADDCAFQVCGDVGTSPWGGGNSGDVDATNGVWHLATAVSYSKSLRRLYVNAQPRMTNQNTLGTSTPTTAAIGQAWGTSYFPGWLDEVRISSVARSDAWIAACYTNQLAPDTLLTPGTPEPLETDWAGAGYAFRRKIAIPAGAVSEPLSDFPVLVSSEGTAATNALKHTAYGGHLQHANGWDLIFTDSEGNVLDHEIEQYDAAAGVFVGWLRVPVLPSSGTILWMYYGREGVTESPENATNVWDHHYMAVWHLNETSGPHADSTAHGNTASPGNGVLQTATGRVAGAASFDNVDDYLEAAANATLDVYGKSELTVEALIHPYGIGENAWGRIVDKSSTTGDTGAGYDLDLTSLSGDTCRIQGRVRYSGSETWKQSTYVVDLNAWQHVAMTLASSHEVDIWVKGERITALQASEFPYGYLLDDTASALRIGQRTAATDRTFDGIIDEVRISDVARSAAWLAASHANQIDPAAFAGLGAEETTLLAYLVLRDSPFAENGGQASVDVRLSEPSASNVVVSLSFSGTADLDVDYTVSTNTVTLTPGTTNATITITSIDDVAPEADETVLVTISNVTGAVLGAPGAVTAVLVSEESWGPGGYGYRRWLVIDSGTVASTLTNFPVLIRVAESELRDTANGGHVESGNGWDIVLTAADETTELDHELERYTATSGEVLAWVRLPTLPADTDTVLWLYYGNPSVTASTERASEVWDSHYIAVWHLNQDPSTGGRPLLDSTVHTNHLSANGSMTSADQYDAVVGYGVDLDRADSDYMEAQDCASLDITGQLTMSGWQNIKSSSDTTYMRVGTKKANYDDADGWHFEHQPSANRLKFFSSSGGAVEDLTQDYAADTWHHYAMTINRTTGRLYSDGAELKNGTVAALVAGPDPFRIGSDGGPAGSLFDGRFDEVRLSDIERSPVWLAACYSNQASPATWVSVGPEAEPGEPAVRLALSAGSYLAESNGTLAVTVELAHSNTVDVTVTFSYSGTAQHNVDFAATNQVTVAAGTTNATFALTGIDDALVEGGETAVVAIDTVQNGYVDFEADQVTATVTDDDILWAAGYAYRVPITVPAGAVASTLTNFPLLVDSEGLPLAGALKHGSYGGAVQSLAGYDVIFTDFGGTNRLDHERELYVPATGQYLGWVRIPFLSNGFDTVIWLYYGKPGVDETTEHAAGVWSAEHLGVWHMNNEPRGAGTVRDSTANAQHGAAMTPVLTNAYVGNGLDFPTADDEAVVPYSPNLQPTSALTLSAWLKPSSLAGYDNVICYPSYYGTHSVPYAEYRLLIRDNGTLGARINGQDSGYYGTSISAGAWRHCAVVWDGSTTLVDYYIDGASVGQYDGTQSSIVYESNHPLLFSERGGRNTEEFIGILDEVRLENVARHANWLAACFSNQVSPATFAVLGAAEGTGRPELALVLTGGALSETNGQAVLTAYLSAPWTNDLTVTFDFNGTATPGIDYTASTNRLFIAQGATNATGTITITPVDDNEPEPTETVVVGIAPASVVQSAWPGIVTVTILSKHRWANAAYAYRLPLTVPAGSVGAPLTNFPLLVDSTGTSLTNQLKHIDDGGRLRSTNGYDVIFVDADELTVLDHEIESYAGAAGTYIGWVRLPLLEPAGKTIWMYYAKAGADAAPSPEHAAGVWDDSYEYVWHFSESSGTNYFDSAGAANTARSPAGFEPAATNGQIVGAQDFGSHAENKYMQTDHDLTHLLGDTATLEVWLNVPSGANTGDDSPWNAPCIVGIEDTTGGDDIFWGFLDANEGIRLQKGDSLPTESTLSVNDGAWHHLTLTRVSASGAQQLYMDGTLHDSDTGNSGDVGRNFNLLGRVPDDNGALGEPWHGALDEVRMSHTIRSAAWVAASYSNQVSPSTFVALGAEEAGGPQVSLALSVETLDENGGMSTLHVRLSRTIASTVTVTLAFSGTAVENTDYTASTNYVTIPSGSTNATVVFTGLDDGVVEGDKQIVIDIDDVTGAIVGTPNQRTLAIREDDVGWAAGYAFRRAFTIDADAVDGTLTNFPVLINTKGTPVAADLKHGSAGGNVYNANGWDLMFTGVDGTTQLSHELELYEPATGTLAAWVRVPIVSGASDTTIWLYYGAHGVASSPENATNVWDEHFLGVWHLAGDPDGAAPQMLDSTRYTNHATVIEEAPGTHDLASIASPVGRAIDFPGAAGWLEVLSVSNNPNNVLHIQSNSLTLEAWCRKPGAGITNQWPAVIDKGAKYNSHWYWLGLMQSTPPYHQPRMRLNYGLSPTPAVQGSDTVADGAWTYLAGTYDGSTAIVWQAGAWQAGDSFTNNLASQATNRFLIGRRQPGPAGSPQWWEGDVDEVRVSDTARSVEWLLACNTNTVSPNTFTTGGPESESALPRAWLSVAGSPTAENGGQATVTVHLSVPATNDVTVTLALSGAATEGTDYTASSTNVVIANGNTSGAVSFTAHDDPHPEGDELVVVTIDTIQNALVGWPGAISVTLVDDDPWVEGYAYRRTITIPADAVPGTLTNFPLLVSTAGTEQTNALKHVSSGGHVEHASGYDVMFTAYGATAPLSHEIDTYQGADGVYVAWVRVPHLHADEDTRLHMYYGNAQLSNDTQNATDVWDGHYMAVWHLDEDPTLAGTPIEDSTANVNDGDPVNMAADDRVGGRVGGGLDFDGVNDYINAAADSTLQVYGKSALTVEAWIYPRTDGEDSMTDDVGGGRIVDNASAENDGGVGYDFGVARGGGTGEQLEGVQLLGRARYSSTEAREYSSHRLAFSEWHHVAFTWNSDDTVTLWGNGVPMNSVYDTESASGTLADDSARALRIGNYGTTRSFDGVLDEIRISDIARSQNWLSACRRNQQDPARFARFGSEAPLGVPEAWLALSNETLSESGGTLTLNVNLTFAPTNDVTVAIVYSGVAEHGLDFTATNQVTIGAGSTNATVSITALPDSDAEGGEGFAAAIASAANAGVGSPNRMAAVLRDDDGGWLDGYQHRRLVTISSNMVPGDLTDYPLLVSTEYVDMANALRHVDSGGAVWNSNGWDIVFAQLDGTNVLDHEIDTYEPGSGQYLAWVRVPSLTADQDTRLLMYYANTNVQASTERATNVWDKHYVGVWHLNQTLVGNDTNFWDSGPFQHHAVAYQPANLTADSDVCGGIVGNCIDFDNQNEMIVASGSDGLTYTQVTVEAWYQKHSSATNTYDHQLCGCMDYVGDDNGFYLASDRVNAGTGETAARRKFLFELADTARYATLNYIDATNWDSGWRKHWHYLAGTWDDTDCRLYYAGAQIAQSGPVTGVLGDTSAFVIGNRGDVLAQGPWTEGIDEVRLSSIDRGSNYLATVYSNVSMPTLHVRFSEFEEDEVEAVVQFTVAASSDSESETNITLWVALDEEAEEPITVQYSATGGTADSPLDYTFAEGALTFEIGTQSNSLVLVVVDDARDESDETVQLALANPVNAVLGANQTHLYTIEDDDPAPSLAFDSGTSGNAESVAGPTLGVSLDAASGRDVTVAYVVTGGTAAGGVDYSLSPGVLTFVAGQTNRTIALTVTDDPNDEPDETILLGLSDPVNAAPGAPTNHTYTIQDDDDPPSVQFDAAGSAEAESSSDPTLGVRLSLASGKQVTVGYAVTGGTASNGLDYVLADGTLTFVPGVTNAVLALSVTDDGIDEYDETVVVTLTNAVDCTVGVVSQHTYTIENDDAALLAFALGSSGASETATAPSLTVRLDKQSSKTITVDYAATGGTATAADYTLGPGTLTFAPGVTNGALAFTVNNDLLDEPDETVQITLSSVSNAVLGAPSVHLYTIQDNDPAPSVAFVSASSSGAETSADVGLGVALSAASGREVAVGYALGGGTAGSGSDYTFSAGVLTFAAGVTNGSIAMFVVDDPNDEPDETVIVGLHSPANGTLGVPTNHTYTIEDDDGPPGVEFRAAFSANSEAVTNAAPAVFLSLASGKQATVGYAVTGGTASNGVDYTLAAGVLTFAAGVTNGAVPIVIENDAVDEPDETIELTLGGTNNCALGATVVHTYTLQNDDGAEVTFASAGSAGPESVSAPSLPVKLTQESVRTITVDYRLTGGTASNGVDFTFSGGSLTFSPGQTNKTLGFTVNDDELGEGNETVEVTLTNASNAVLGAYPQHMYTIQDDDGPPPVSFAGAASAAAEPATSLVLDVGLEYPSALEVTVDYDVTGGTTAESGTDYVLADGTLTFTPGITNRTITATLQDDLIDEPDETIELTLSNTNNCVLGAYPVHTYTIQDDEPTPTLTFDTDASGNAESTTGPTIGLSLEPASSAEVTVHYAATGGTASNGQDYTLADGVLTFAPGNQSADLGFTVSNDGAAEDDETIVIALSAPTNAMLGWPAVHVYTIEDNDVGAIERIARRSQWQYMKGTAEASDPRTAWRELDFGDAGWSSGAAPFGYGSAAHEGPDCNTVLSDMQGNYSTVFLRRKFLVGSIRPESRLRASVDYDDSFILWINGRRVWDEFEPDAAPLYNSLAAGGHEAGAFETNDLGSADGILQLGENVAAVMVLNAGLSSSDLKFDMDLHQYKRVEDTKFSHDRGFYDAPFDLTISTATIGATIRYTTDGTPPTESYGATGVTTVVIPVSGTLCVRAAAFMAAHEPTDVDTQSYIFLADVLSQAQPAGYPDYLYGYDKNSNLITHTGDYEMASSVVSNPVYAGVFTNALKSIPSISIVMDKDDIFSSQGFLVNGWSGANDTWEKPCSAELIYPDGYPNAGNGFQINCGVRPHSHVKQKRSMKLMFRGDYGATKLRYPFFESAAYHADTACDRFDKVILRAGMNRCWATTWGCTEAVYTRDQWNRDTQILMWGHGKRGLFVHVYLNGMYWGLYNATERADEGWATEYFGGEKEDWFAANHGGDITDTIAYPTADDRWDYLIDTIGNNGSLNIQSNYETFMAYVNVQQFVDYVTLGWFVGFGDWQEWWGANNFYFVNRNSPAQPGMYIMWDSESSWHIEQHIAGRANDGAWIKPQFLTESELGDAANVYMGTRYNWYNATRHKHVARPFRNAFKNSDFRTLYADRLYKHAKNGGLLSDTPCRARWMALCDIVEDPIVCEEARWGDHVTGLVRTGNEGDQYPSRSVTYTSFGRNLHVWSGDNPEFNDNPVHDTWYQARDHVYNMMVGNADRMITLSKTYQMNGTVIYPLIDPPEFSQHGGTIQAGFLLTITNPNGAEGTLVYKADGTDPRVWDGTGAQSSGTQVYSSPLALGKTTHIKARVRKGNATWSAVHAATYNYTAHYPGIRITEIHYNPLGGGSFEFIEIQNTVSSVRGLSEMTFSKGIRYTFEPGAELGPGQFALLVRDEAAFTNMYPDAASSTNVAIFGVFDGQLDNGGERLELVDNDGVVVTSVRYNDNTPWPQEADGDGYSLVFDGLGDQDDAGKWRASNLIGGSPGYNDGVAYRVVINEALTHTDLPELDAIELYNAGQAAVEIGGWYLSDSDEQYRKFELPSHLLGAGGYVTYDETDFNTDTNDPACFALSSHGDEIYLTQWDAVTNLLYRTEVRFGGAANGIAFGRHVRTDYEVDFVAQSATNTLGAANAYPRVGPVVINELMYHPSTNLGHYEYLELVNISDGPIALYNGTNSWKLDAAVDYVFPTGIVLAAKEYVLVVPTNEAAFRFVHEQVPENVRVFGPYERTLDNAGESVKLWRPGEQDAEGLPWILADRVKYNDNSPWPESADGDGPALERNARDLYGNDPANWSAGTSGGTPGEPNSGVLVSRTAGWLYHDLGSDLGTGWREPDYDDTGWDDGNAPLGYPDTDPAIDTELDFGDDPGAKNVTTYFRRKFMLGSEPHHLASLDMTVRYDDGFVAYLNGQEVARGCMPGGAIGYGTLAATNNGSGALYEAFDLIAHTNKLVRGVNVLAVELHQYAAASSDLFLDLDLKHTLTTPTVAFANASSAGSETNTSVQLAVNLAPVWDQSVQVDYALAGGTASNGLDYTFEAGTLTFDPGMTTRQIGLTVANDELVEGDETVNVRLSGAVNAALGTLTNHTYTIQDNDPAPIVKIAKGSSWRYRKGNAEASDPVAQWRELAFDDGAWSTGNAPFGYGLGPYGTELGDMSNSYSCVFLRQEFQVPVPAFIREVRLWSEYDDGFVMWLNGEEFARVNMAGTPGSSPAYNALAAGSVGAAQVWTVNLSGADMPVLQPTTNVLAVQFFNDALDSEDASLDVELAVVEARLPLAEDADQDGMPDGWETLWLSATTNTAAGDFDLDGTRNLAEYVAGTHPTNPTSFFLLDGGRSGTNVLISFPTIEASGTGYSGLSRYYKLEKREAMGAGHVWQALPGCSNIVGRGQDAVYTNTIPQTPLFFRGRVWLE